MKNGIKKIMALMLACTFAFAIPVTGYAANETKFDEIINLNETDNGIVSEENEENLNDNEQPNEPATPEETEPQTPTYEELPGDSIVARMYICTQIVFLGHSWIYIENKTDSTIPVGCIAAEPYDGVSVGTFFFSRSDGMGVYYNVEQYCAEHYGLNSEIWLGVDITKDQLEKVNNEITNWNYWGLYLNCTFFASKVWNSVSDDFIMPMMFPMFTKAQINTKGGSSDVTMKHVEPEKCYKQKGSGKNVRVEVVSAKSLDSRML